MLTAATDRRIDKLLRLLVANATVVLPGPKIASEIGVTRSTVWMWIEKLRRLGVEIRGHVASGYQLMKLPDILAPSLVRAELGEGEMGKKIVHFFRTDSTNRVAQQLAAEAAPHGTVVLAEEQTAGRGRFGRPWYSEATNGIYVSIIIRPPLAPTAAPVLTLMAAVAVQQALSSAGFAPDIRWPNDVLINGKKVCGILTEMNAELDRLYWLVLGIGLNVNHRVMPAELKEIATSLQIETGKHFSRLQILAALLKELQKIYRRLLAEGSQAVIRRWTAASSYAEGKRIRFVSQAGGTEAITAGLDLSGALRVRLDDGREELLTSGEVVEVK